MKAFKLDRKGKITWDEACSFVIIANDETEARALANTDCGDEGQIWDDPEKTSCVDISTLSGPQIICQDYNAG